MPIRRESHFSGSTPRISRPEPPDPDAIRLLESEELEDSGIELFSSLYSREWNWKRRWVSGLYETRDASLQVREEQGAIVELLQGLHRKMDTHDKSAAHRRDIVDAQVATVAAMRLENNKLRGQISELQQSNQAISRLLSHKYRAKYAAIVTFLFSVFLALSLILWASSGIVLLHPILAGASLPMALSLLALAALRSSREEGQGR
jgi:hypothetical protein